MKKLINMCLVVVFSLFTMLSTTANAGHLYPWCVLICSTACHFVPLCVAGCLKFCILSCFDKTTKISVLYEGQIVEKNVDDVQSNDLVLTLSKGQKKWTKVLQNVETIEPTRFLQINFVGLNASDVRDDIKVTPEHGVILVNDEGKRIITPAKNVQVGDKMVSDDNEILSVAQVNEITMDKRYTLATEEGTVLASGILVTTICDEEIDDNGVDADIKLPDWINRHSLANLSVFEE